MLERAWVESNSPGRLQTADVMPEERDKQHRMPGHRIVLEATYYTVVVGPPLRDAPSAVDTTLCGSREKEGKQKWKGGTRTDNTGQIPSPRKGATSGSENTDRQLKKQEGLI